MTTTPKLLIEAMAAVVIEHADELTMLDQAIGDGDHGLNMKRGFEAVLAQIDNLASKPLPEALVEAGTILVMKVGGASGPLYGTLLRTIGRELPAEPTNAEAARAFGSAIDAIKRLGKSDVGQKTLLDVLVAARDEFALGGADVAQRVARRVAAAADATIPMKAIKGRASFLGERSIGHMDPGARSSALMISAVCQVMEN